MKQMSIYGLMSNRQLKREIKKNYSNYEITSDLNYLKIITELEKILEERSNKNV